MADEAAKSWLENIAAKGKKAVLEKQDVWEGGFFDSLFLSALDVSRAEAGRVLCTFIVPHHLADKDGNWQAGAIATLIDDVGAAAIMSTVGHIKISVDFDISYFSPAKINEVVEIEGRVLEHKGRLSAVVVEIRKKGSGDLVALGRQWMASARPRNKSKL